MHDRRPLCLDEMQKVLRMSQNVEYLTMDRFIMSEEGRNTTGMISCYLLNPFHAVGGEEESWLTLMHSNEDIYVGFVD
jgi:hypothetical protein